MSSKGAAGGVGYKLQAINGCPLQNLSRFGLLAFSCLVCQLALRSEIPIIVAKEQKSTSGIKQGRYAGNQYTYALLSLSHALMAGHLINMAQGARKGRDFSTGAVPLVESGACGRAKALQPV
jgi:hypothetical protein